MVLAVNGWNESQEVVESFVKEKQLKQKVLLRGGEVAREKYFVEGYPTTFLIDREQKIRYRDAGFSAAAAGFFETKLKAFLSVRPEGQDPEAK